MSTGVGPCSPIDWCFTVDKGPFGSLMAHKLANIVLTLRRHRVISKERELLKGVRNEDFGRMGGLDDQNCVVYAPPSLILVAGSRWGARQRHSSTYGG